MGKEDSAKAVEIASTGSLVTQQNRDALHPDWALRIVHRGGRVSRSKYKIEVPLKFWLLCLQIIFNSQKDFHWAKLLTFGKMPSSFRNHVSYHIFASKIVKKILGAPKSKMQSCCQDPQFVKDFSFTGGLNYKRVSR